MNARILKAIRNYRLNHAGNPVLIQLREAEWHYRQSTAGMDNLFDDLLNGSVTIKDALFSFNQSAPHLDYMRKNRDPKQEAKNKQIAVESYFSSQGFAKDKVKELEQGWKTGLVDLMFNVLNQAILNQGYTITAIRRAEINYLKNQWQVSVVISDISLDTNDKSHPIANTLTSTFVLKDRAFQLTPFHSDNTLLEDMCFKKCVLITPSLLTQQSKEVAFLRAVDKLEEHIKLLDESNDKRIKPSEDVLKEVKRLKSTLFSQVPIEQLTTILTKVDDLLFPPTENTSPDIKSFKALAEEVGKRSWGKQLASLMIALAGVVLTIVGILSLAPSAGASSAAIVIGAGLMFTGGFTMYRSIREKPIKKNMDALAIAAEQHYQR